MEKNLTELLKKRILEKTALETTYESETGEILRSDMADSIAETVYQLASNYRTLSHIEMIALCAKMEGIINVSSLLKNAKIAITDLKERMEE